MFYKNNIDICNDKQMFNFLKEHFSYSTLNSWNGLRSIANNVKVYNLELDGDPYTALRALEQDEYFNVNMMIEDWEAKHPNYRVGFNGRSGGYLVLYNKTDNCNVLPDYIVDGDYEDYKQYIKDYYGTLKDNRSNLRYLTELVRDFDKLCDDIREYVNLLSTIDFVEEFLIGVVEDFNETFYPDLHKWEANPLEVVDKYSICIEEIQNSPALMEALKTRLNNASSYGLRVNYTYNYLYVEEN